MSHWSEQHVAFLRSVTPEIADVPIYLLKVDESAIEWNNAWMACFSPLADLRSQPELERLGLWRGRGICIVVRSDFESWSNRCRIGTSLHEAAHAIEYLSQQDDALCPLENLSPVARELLDGSESELLQNAGIDARALSREQHGADFVRLCLHLHRRAASEMMISPGDLQFLHGAYSLGSEKYEAVAASLAGELAMSKNLNLLRLKDPPAAFLELFQ